MAYLFGVLTGFMFTLFIDALCVKEEKVLGWLKRLWPNEKPYLIRNGNEYGVAKKGFYEIRYYSFIHRKYFSFLVDGSWTDREAAEAFIASDKKEYERVE